MPISVVCPTCDKPLRAPESAAGRPVTCPGCGGRLVLPSADDRALAILRRLEPAAPSERGSPPPSLPTQPLPPPVPPALPPGAETRAPAPPPARRSRLAPVLVLLLLAAGGVAGWAVTSLAERDRRIAALAAEVAQLRADGDGRLARATAEAEAAKNQAERAAADQRRALEQTREAAARPAATRPAPTPPQPRPEPPRKRSVSETVEEGIVRPARFTAVQLIPQQTDVGTSGVLYSLTVDRILDETAAVLRDNLDRKFLAINFPTKGLVDGRPIARDASRGAEATAVRVIGTFVLSGRTLFVVEL